MRNNSKNNRRLKKWDLFLFQFLWKNINKLHISDMGTTEIIHLKVMSFEKCRKLVRIFVWKKKKLLHKIINTCWPYYIFIRCLNYVTDIYTRYLCFEDKACSIWCIVWSAVISICNIFVMLEKLIHLNLLSFKNLRHFLL